ncbi:hypothetical protein [Algoriphagus aquimarinus]|uniref:Uncharacterized protein n=1 Tax=Algoriphagus aquimarinus TaxID=237018 RepID=A0A5C7ARE2_9BACT|nr:hypothetical protein [Algoriphagus aquimarinus]TXE11220.1 hypothetical protein ESV85_11785 [Algoriphagus aquimarinus]
MKDKTIAMLPFVNMSSNVENEYFSDGITEEIINATYKPNLGREVIGPYFNRLWTTYRLN